MKKEDKFCPNGHAMTPENTFYYNRTFNCKQCRSDLAKLKKPWTARVKSVR